MLVRMLSWDTFTSKDRKTLCRPSTSMWDPFPHTFHSHLYKKSCLCGNGLPANVGYHQCGIPSYLDVPSVTRTDAVDLPDPQNPFGARGIGEPAMGCAVAAAVSASFNAPIAGTLFALEVVLRHFAVHAFAPIAIASVAGTVVSRLAFGDITEFSLPDQTMLAFYQELPAFLILGLVCGVVAFVLMRAIFWPTFCTRW